VNAVAPTPVTNAEFTRTLGRVLGRPTTILRVPAFAARLAFGGEMADELLLTSQRVMPARLQASGFTFRHPTLEGALRHELGGRRPRDAGGGGRRAGASRPRPVTRGRARRPRPRSALRTAPRDSLRRASPASGARARPPASGFDGPRPGSTGG